MQVLYTILRTFKNAINYDLSITMLMDAALSTTYCILGCEETINKLVTLQNRFILMKRPSHNNQL